VEHDADTTAASRALERARELAARERELAGPEPAVGLDVEPPERITASRLAEWAIIEPDPANVRSTRRLGAPITWAKRGLVRILRQYNDQIVAQQTRFNAHVAAHLLSLDERVSELERRQASRAPDPGREE
jgi:hypothetical protein